MPTSMPTKRLLQSNACYFNAPTSIFVRLLKRRYKEQTMQIKWGKHFSEPFHVSNGVRQGGVLSPYLFAICLDDLSNELNTSKQGAILVKSY